MISFKNVNLVINDKPILTDVSMSIPDNKKTVIIGKSGCGKTMLMKTLERLYIPQSGTIIIDDIEINASGVQNRLPILDKIAMVFQNAALLDSFTVFQNISLPLFEKHIMTDEQIKNEVSDVLKLVGLEKISDLYPSELSGGMRKRIGLARALVINPKYLILDEPTTGLDPFTAEEVMSFLKRVIKDKEVVPVTITHDPYCINELGDYVVMMDEGRVLYNGDKSEIENQKDYRIPEFYRSFFL